MRLSDTPSMKEVTSSKDFRVIPTIGIQWDPPPLSLKQPVPAPDLDGGGNGGLLKACEKLVRSARKHPVGEGGWEVRAWFLSA